MRVLEIVWSEGFLDLPANLSENELPSALVRAIAGEKHCVHHKESQCEWPAHVVEEVLCEDGGRTVEEGFFNPERKWCLYFVTNYTSGQQSYYCGPIVGD